VVLVRPLSGVKVLDVTVARAGPTAVRFLADWGAEVIRIETPGEDPGVSLEHTGSDYINLHCNKRLINLDLKAPAGRDIFLALASQSDVMVENFRPSVKHKLGIDYETLAQLNPRLVYGSISGFGQDGPSADLGAVDQVIQGSAGLMSITGMPDGPPTRVGVAIADIGAGIMLANGILLALLDRQQRGEGQWVQVSLTEAVLNFLDFQAVRWLTERELPARAGNDHPTLAPMGTYRAADGFLNLAAPGERLFTRMCHAIGADQLLADPRFSSNKARGANKEELKEALQAILETRGRAEWVRLLGDVGVPVGPVNSIEEAFADPQVEHLGVAVEFAHPSRGKASVLRSPIRLSSSEPAPKIPSPVPGQDTDAILAELGFSEGDIATLHSQGVV
jgi:crotonobetainyl-CoA:carnitine CoA-transferase CaiB-like acyl-CoA transferase